MPLLYPEMGADVGSNFSGVFAHEGTERALFAFGASVIRSGFRKSADMVSGYVKIMEWTSL